MIIPIPSKATIPNNILNTSLNLSLRSAYFPTRIQSAKVGSHNNEMEKIESSLILSKFQLETTKNNTNFTVCQTDGNEKPSFHEEILRIFR
jgi:hypothetical protein